MTCGVSDAVVVLVGLTSGVVLGFLFRNSDAERKQFMNSGYRHWVLRALYSPIWSLQGLATFILMLAIFAFALWFPLHVAGIGNLCGATFRWHKVGLIGGALVGWFLRYLLWRLFLWRL